MTVSFGCLGAGNKTVCLDDCLLGFLEQHGDEWFFLPSESYYLDGVYSDLQHVLKAQSWDSLKEAKKEIRSQVASYEEVYA
ncbi:hypothetical protein [Parasutterella sp.]|uniref:hypothetical protein n=1 Tax=Parasutterella sp. TaxID=2049037 RepID=UPI0035201655